MRDSYRVLALFFPAALALAPHSACSEGNTEREPLLPSTASFGTEGGHLRSEDGTELAVPSGALAEEVTLRVLTAESPLPPSAEGTVAVSQAALLLPHGTRFERPVTVVLPYQGPADNLVLLRLDDERDLSWERFEGVQFEDGLARFETQHFSVYQVFLDNRCGGDGRFEEVCNGLDDDCDSITDEECSCLDGATPCGGDCVDLSSSSQHCGGCDRPCASGECRNAECVGCPDGQISCAKTCTDTRSDSLHCGNCGQACGRNEACIDAHCTPNACDVDAESCVVGAAGGTFSSQELQLTFAENALSEEHRVSVSAQSASAAAPDGLKFVSEAYVLTPHGLSFSQPVRVSFPIREADGSAVRVWRLDDENDTTWEPLQGVQVAGGRVAFETGRFSIYRATVALDPCRDINCDDGDACTVDSCDSVARCQHTAVRCDDGQTCKGGACICVPRCPSDVECGATDGCGGRCSTGACSEGQTCTAGRCTRPPVCGDRIVSGSEQCDDGNLLSGDGCSSSCRIEARGYYL